MVTPCGVSAALQETVATIPGGKPFLDGKPEQIFYLLMIMEKSVPILPLKALLKIWSAK
jgi:hypothetical protein